MKGISMRVLCKGSEDLPALCSPKPICHAYFIQRACITSDHTLISHPSTTTLMYSIIFSRFMKSRLPLNGVNIHTSRAAPYYSPGCSLVHSPKKKKNRWDIVLISHNAEKELGWSGVRKEFSWVWTASVFLRWSANRPPEADVPASSILFLGFSPWRPCGRASAFNPPARKTSRARMAPNRVEWPRNRKPVCVPSFFFLSFLYFIPPSTSRRPQPASVDGGRERGEWCVFVCVSAQAAVCGRQNNIVLGCWEEGKNEEQKKWNADGGA